jgi:hypothetical protein
MMLPRANKTLDLFFAITIFLTAFSTKALQTCHMHKNTLALSQMLLQMQA